MKYVDRDFHQKCNTNYNVSETHSNITVHQFEAINPFSRYLVKLQYYFLKKPTNQPPLKSICFIIYYHLLINNLSVTVCTHKQTCLLELLH